MANPIKGEVAFEAGGRAYTLVLDINALCTLEDRLDMSVDQIAASLGKGMRLGVLRLMFWAGLQAKHPGVPEVGVGDILGDLIREHGAQRAGELIGQAFTAAFPQAKEDANASEDPRKTAAAGTGPAS